MLKKLITVTVLSSVATTASAQCDDASKEGILTEVGAFGISQLVNGGICANFVLGTVMDSVKMEDFNMVHSVQTEFCTADTACNTVITGTIDLIARLEANYPTCVQEVMDDMEGNLRNIFKDMPEGFKVTDILEHLKASVCDDLKCGTSDAACWICEGAELVGMVAPANGFCTDVPFCTAPANGGCDLDPSKKCNGGATMALFESKIQAVADNCNVELILADNNCVSECKTALMDFEALASITLDDAKVSGGTISKEDAANAFLCLMDAAGKMSDLIKDSIPDIGALLPSMLSSGAVSETETQLNSVCSIEAGALEALEAPAEEALAQTILTDQEAAGADSGVSSLVPATSILLLGAAALF